MKMYQFEQYIKSSLSTSNAPLDTGSFMQGLFEEMDRMPQRKRIFPFWWAGAIAALLLLTGLYWGLMSSSGSSPTPLPKSPKVQSPLMATSTSENIVNTATQETSPDAAITETTLPQNTHERYPKQTNRSYAASESNPKTPYLAANNHDLEESAALSTIADQTEWTNIAELESSIRLLDERLLSYDFNNQVKCPTFGRTKHFSFYLIPEIGYFSSNKTLEYVGNEPTDVFALRNANESTKEGLAAALYLQANHNTLPFYLKAGISYGRITERMDLSYRYTVQDTTQGIISITVSQTGDTITTIVGDIITERTISGQRRQHHYHHLIDIPVAIGFEQSYDRWFYGAELGISLNVSLFQSGQILANANEFVPVEETGQFKNNIGLGLFGGVHVGYKITDHLSAFLAARYRHLPGNFTVQQSDIQQSYSLMGVHAGIRIPLQW